MMAKRYYWLKLMENFFRQKEIKKLRKIAGGDTFTIIYQEMMLLSLQNEGKLYFDDFGEDIAEEIALELDEAVENVRMTISYLMAHGLMTVQEEDNQYILEKVPIMVGSESASAERMRRFREKQKSEDVTLLQKSDVNASLCDIEVTPQLRREEKRREEKIKEKNNKKENNSNSKNQKKKYAERISLTDKQYKELLEKLNNNEEVLMEVINKASKWLVDNDTTRPQTGRFLNNWIDRGDYKQKSLKPKESNKLPDFDFDDTLPPPFEF